MIEKMELIAVVVLAIVCVVLGVTASQYRRLYHASDLALQTQNQALEQQKQTAARELAAAQEQVDTKTRALTLAVKQQQERESDFNKKLEDLRAALDKQPPFRVRLVPGSCGGGGQSTAGAGATAARGGDQAPAPATGLLDPETSSRLRGYAIEVEELQRDFNTCRGELIGRHDAHVLN